MTEPQISSPAGFVPEYALAFGGRGSPAVAVDASNPLPITARLVAAGSTPLAGSAAASGIVGPFLPDLDRAIWLNLSGTWSGSVQLLRSTDGGATKLPLTYGDGTPKPSWTMPLQAVVASETVAGASYWLAITVASGTVAYRMEQ
jgi:hypothetical protein